MENGTGILAAAVSDYYVPNPLTRKARSDDFLNIKLEPLPKLINKVKNIWVPGTKLVGFKLLVGSISTELVAASRKSIAENGCDMVVANDLEDIKFNKHKLTLVFPMGEPIIYETDPKDPNFLARMVASHCLSL